MPCTICYYIPGGGGNHLKNLLSITGGFCNSHDFDPAVYSDVPQPTGTVHSVPGRNIHEGLVHEVCNSRDQDWLLLGHFGELAPWRETIREWPDVRWIILSIDSEQDRMLLRSRHQRLQQHIHPYWLDEEQPWLYHRDMCAKYFGADETKVITISLEDFWCPDVNQSQWITQCEQFLKLTVPRQAAQTLHDIWWRYNFFFDWNRGVKEHWGVKEPRGPLQADKYLYTGATP